QGPRDDLAGPFGDRKPAEVGRLYPPPLRAVVAADDLARGAGRESAEEVDQDVVIAYPPVVVADDPLEHLAHRPRLDDEAGLLAHLALDGGAKRLARLDGAAGERPLPRVGRVAAPGEEHQVPVEHHGADADDGAQRVLAVAHGPPVATGQPD